MSSTSKDKMMAALLALPDPDLLDASSITDELGADGYYRADTVVRLLAAEREACAALCKQMKDAVWPYHDEARVEIAKTVCDNLEAAIRARSP